MAIFNCERALDFCRQFEEAGMRTQNFVEELEKHKLLMDGEVAIQQDGQEQPFVYRGFKMVDETKLRELRGDVLRIAVPAFRSFPWSASR